MRKLIMWNSMTLDGFFEGAEPWALNWHEWLWDDDLQRFSVEQLRSADMLLFGRVTYEGMAAYWQKATSEVADFMNKLPKVVVSRSLERADWVNTTLIKSDVFRAIYDFKQQGDKNIFVFGSAHLCADLMRHGLFDEYRIALARVVMGRGKALFGRDLKESRMKLVEARPLPSGCIILRYEPLSG